MMNFCKKLPLIPAQSTGRDIVLLFLAGLLIRLLLMPFFCHVDFLSEMRRVHETLLTGHYYPGKTRLVVYFIEMISMRIFLPFLPDADTMFFIADGASTTAGIHAFSLFVSDPYIFRTLFLLKIPYLLFDMGTALVLYKLFIGKRHQFAAVACWLFNPVTLYAFYIFGRYESISIFFISLSIFLLKERRWLPAALMLGLAVNSREMYIFFIPLFVLSLFSRHEPWHHNIKKLAAPTGLLMLMLLGPALIQKIYHLHPFFVNKVSVVSHEIGRFWGLQINWFSPFFAGYASLCLFLIESRNRDVMYRYTLSAGLTIAWFFFCCTHSAHYASWLIIFPIVMLYFGRDTLFPFLLYCLVWILFWLFNTDAGVFTLFLASPVHKTLFAYKTIPQLYEMHAIPRGLPPLQFIRWFLHTMYAVSIGYLMIMMVKRRSDVA